MNLQRTDYRGLPRFLATGLIEAYEAAEMTDAIRSEIEEKPGLLLLEFKGNGCVSATIIGHLIWLQRLARFCDSEIVIVRPPRLLCRSLNLLRSGAIFRCFPTAEEAAAALPPILRWPTAPSRVGESRQARPGRGDDHRLSA